MFRIARNYACWVLALALLMVSMASSRGVTVDRYWELSPYRVKVIIRSSLPTIESDPLSERLAIHLGDRIDASLGALWDANFEIKASTTSQPLDSPPIDSLVAADVLPQFDKVMLIQIDSVAGRYRVTTQEFDNYAAEWGQPAIAETTSLGYVPELCFRSLIEVFAPIATYSIKRGDDASVAISFKGSALPKRSSIDLTPVGAILAPLLRKIDSSGNPVENGIDRVKWSYIEVDDSQPVATSGIVHSHTNRPFGFRQRGRVEQLALLVRETPTPVTLRLYNRNDEDEGLAGLDVYLQNTGEKETRELGKTDLSGEIEVPPGPTRIQTAYVKSGAIAVAKIPLLPGDLDLVEAPLPDHRDRLAAEAKLAAIREELIDVVARRSIMAARIDQFIESKDFATARKILGELDDLPGRSQFEVMLNKEQQLVSVKDPMVEQQINRLFDETKGLLNQFLDASLSQQLRSKIAAAEGGEVQASR